MSNPGDHPSPGPSGTSSPEAYQSKRSRNNLAVKKCREAKRQQEKEMLEAVSKQKELNKRLEEEYEKARMEEQMLRAMLPFCAQSASSKPSTNNDQTKPDITLVSTMGLSTFHFASSSSSSSIPTTTTNHTHPPTFPTSSSQKE